MKGVKSALDLGGGPGTYSMEMARKIDSVTLFDLPSTIAIAKDIIMQDRNPQYFIYRRRLSDR